MLADQRHKRTRTAVFRCKAFFGTRRADEDLRLLISADRDHHSSTDLQLLDQRLRYFRTAVVYSNYSYELENGGQRSTRSGRVTEVFVLRDGQWVNPGWHLDSGK